MLYFFISFFGKESVRNSKIEPDMYANTRGGCARFVRVAAPVWAYLSFYFVEFRTDFSLFPQIIKKGGREVKR